MPNLPLDLLLRLAVAALGGLAVGIEREWSSRAAGRKARFAGVRTFLLMGLLGGMAAIAAGGGSPLAGAVLLGTASLLVVAAYVVHGMAGDLDGTTEVAALVTLAVGYVAGSGQAALASAMAAVVALVLVEKTRVHGWVERLRIAEIEAGVRFAVMALVVLPILPKGPFGPAPGVQPRELWWLVLVFSGLSFAGYVAVRVAGPERGYGLAGLLGGLVSSTGVTLTYARESREEGAPASALALGVVAANVVLYLRVLVLTWVLAPAVAQAALAYLLPPIVAGAGFVAWLLSRRSDLGSTVARSAGPPANPLRLASAIQMTLLFQAVLYVLHFVRAKFGSSGLLVSAGAVGLADVDALVFTLAKLGSGGAAELSARALGVGIASNAVFKLSLALSFGTRAFRSTVAAGILLLLATGIAALAFL